MDKPSIWSAPNVARYATSHAATMYARPLECPLTVDSADVYADDETLASCLSNAALWAYATEWSGDNIRLDTGTAGY